jgi:hypothetical protein
MPHDTRSGNPELKKYQERRRASKSVAIASRRENGTVQTEGMAALESQRLSRDFGEQLYVVRVVRAGKDGFPEAERDI